MAIKETRLKKCIEELSSKNTDYKFPEQAINQAESLKSLSSDLYTDNIRFIYELIQNADDAQAKNIILTILENKYLIVAYDGNVFDEKDLQGLCGVNNGTKKKDLDKTGYKGLGFKAVFGKSDKVIIYSNEEYFRFDSSYKIKWNKEWGTNDQQTWEKENDRQFIYPWQINPVWTDQNEIPNFIKDFLNPRREQIHVANIIELNNVEEIRLAIDQLKEQPYMFLFLRSISEMTFFTESTDVISIDRDLNFGLKKIYFNKKVVSQWIIKRIGLDVPDDIREKLANDSKAPDKLRSTKKAEVYFAAKYKDPIIDQDEIVVNPGGIEKLRDQESILFSYLPTKILEYKFPVLVNTNFLTNVNREQIHIDSVWNQWLFGEIGNEIIQWIKELVTDEKFRFQSYRLIPSKLNLANNILAKRFNESFETSVKHCDFILNRENQPLRVDEAVMDSTSMSEQTSFINLDSMRQYIIDYHKNKSFQCATHPFIDYDSNLQRVGVRQFTWHDCIEMFKSDIFLKTHSIEQNTRMIEYFYTKYSKLGTVSELGTPIERIPFIMDQNNRLQLARDIYFPAETIGDNKKNDSKDLFVNEIIFDWLNEDAPKEIKEWLLKLGIIERTDLTYLHKTIIPNVTTVITAENAIKTIKTLFMLFQKNSIGKKELDQLRQLRLLTTRRNLIAAEQCFFSDEYKPRLQLEEYLKTKEDRFLSSEYMPKSIYRRENEDLAEWRRFFTMLGVQEEFHAIEFSQKLTRSEAITYGFCHKYLLRPSPNGRHFVDAFSRLITIIFLQHTNNNYDFAKFFWSYIIKNIRAEKLIQNIRVYWGYSDQRGAINGTLVDDANYVEWFVKNIECIPTTLNTCELSSKIFIETKEMKELCGKYMPFPSIPLPHEKTSWHRIFSFKTKFSINDYFDLLEKIRHDEKHLKDNFDRIQMIYSYILKEISVWSINEQMEIRTRASKIYLLTETDQWELANILYFYMEEDGANNTLNGTNPCLKLNFKNKTDPHLHKFLELLSIKQITRKDLKLIGEGFSHAEQFRKKIIEISPFVKKWLKKMAFPSDVILSIDKTLQQEIDFIESDCLKLFYNEKFFQETNVYNDTVHQKFYITRPWHCETTLMDLPDNLCQLLKIQGFEKKLGFLLRAEREEIIKTFKKNSIEIPTDKDIISLKPLSRSEIVEEAKPSTTLPPESKEFTSSVKDKETGMNKNANILQVMETIGKSENGKHTISSSTDVKRGCKDSFRHRQDSFHDLALESTEAISTTMNKPIRSLSSAAIESDDEQIDNIQVIDISSIATSNSVLFQSLSGITEECDESDLHTGRIGERMVYKYLLHEYRDHLNSVTIEWLNKNRETHLPYDILLTKNGKTDYIEVKSTRTCNQHTFPLSINQIETFLQHTENYFIYRVYLDENKLLILDNIRSRLKKQQRLACFLTIT